VPGSSKKPLLVGKRESGGGGAFVGLLCKIPDIIFYGHVDLCA